MMARTVVVCLVLCVSASAQAGVIYVSTGGYDANDGRSWTAAKRTVQAGLNAAVGGDQVWVAAGTYVECVTLRRNVALYGGFAGSETDLAQRDWTVNRTVLDADQAGSVVTVPEVAVDTTRIDGFVIRNGKPRSGTCGGIYCYSCSPTIANNTITDNNGSGIYCSYSAPKVVNNRITNNTGAAYGGIYCSSSSPLIINCAIMGNAARSGAGIYCSLSSSPTIANSTIAGNNASANGGALYCDYSSSPLVVNTIVSFNSSGLYNGGIGGGAPALRRNCVYGNGAYNYSGLTDPTGTDGNISVDPKLAGVSYGNVHLQADSPCVDAGDSSVVQAGWLDLDGQDRVLGGVVDIGADESDGTVWPSEPNVVVRVGPGGDDGNDGSSWSLAKRTVQAAIDAVAPVGGEVWVQAGTYDGCIRLPSFVHIFGGFAGAETQRAERTWSTHVTVLDGGQAGSVVTVTGGYRVGTIDGFTVRNGNGTVSGATRYGGGIYCESSSPTITNNTITGNSATLGGGVCCSSSLAVIAKNTITGNSASNGGGIFCENASPTIIDNAILGNNASSGGGIYCDSCSPTIMNNMIAGNAASSGGGLWCQSTSALIANNRLIGNGAFSSGGAVYCGTSASATIANNTIAGNNARTGGGVYCSGSSPSITNTIIALNSSGIYRTGTQTPSLRHNCVYANGAYNYSGLADPTGTNGNISADPKLADLSYGNVHIQPDSPCIDAGDSNVVQADWADMDDQPRKLGTHVDIGADESDGTVWPVGPHMIVRVSPSGNDANDGSSWILAKRTVQAGIDAAAAGGGEVWVQEAVYGERITLRSFAPVYGGFAGSETQRSERDWAAHATILDGGQGGSVVTALSGYRVSAIDGFTIRNGNGTLYGSYDRLGGGIYCRSSSPMITNNTIAANSATEGGGIHCHFASDAVITNNTIMGNKGSYGGGIFCVFSSPMIARNTITGNNAIAGGGIYCPSSPAATIASNTITGNTATGGDGSGGGGIHCSGPAVIVNNRIVGNIARFGPGGGMYCSSSPTVANNAIVANSARYGGGVYCASASSPTIAGNTVAGNEAYEGGGTYCASSSTPTIVNTIVAFNSSGIFSLTGGTPSLRYNCVYDNGGYDYSGLADPTGTDGNISVDPRLAALAYGNVHIQPDSPCLNAGDGSAVQAGWQDIDGQDRLLGGSVDMGADESDGTIWSTEPNVIVRVSPDGADPNDGSSWSLAKRTVQAAIDLTAIAGGEVWAKAGTYSERITLRNFAHVYGGFAGTETERSARDCARHVTILDGGQGGSVVTATGGYDVSTVDGFTIRNGWASEGGGVYCRFSSPRIANNTITGNSSSYGGGIWCEYASPTITNNTITVNSATGTGGDGGGGVFCSYSSATITNNTIAGNSGSGIYCGAGSPTIVNNTIAGNSGLDGGGILCSYSSATIANTIVAFNSSGIYKIGPETVSLRHNCVYGNQAYNYSYYLPDPTGADGNISADPKLAALAYGNVHIQPDSPCLNAGDGSLVHVDWRDIDGQDRVLNGLVDIGADESDGTTWASEPNVIVRVSPTGDDGDDGSSWALAKRTVQAAIDAAGAAGGEVWVAEGIYTERITLRNFAHLYGGFAGTETARSGRDWSSHATALDGGQAGSVVTAVDIAPGLSRIDGFTLRNGTGTGSGGNRYGGGIYCKSSAPTIANNTIVSNSATYGGGIYCYYASPAVENNTITGNSAPSGVGGGIYCSNLSPIIAGNTVVGNSNCAIYCSYSSPTIINNTITGNSGGGISCSSASPTVAHNTIEDNTGYNGGGIRCESSSAIISSNTIVGNTASGSGGGIYGGAGTISNNTIRGNTASTSGGGIYCTLSAPIIRNNMIADNSASSGGGLYCRSSSSARIVSNTIAGNSASSGGGVYSYSSSPTIVNTIIAFNSSGVYKTGTAAPVLRYTCVFGNTAYNFSGLTDPTGTNGNISINPLFVDAAGGDCHLLPLSPCLNAGDPGYVPAAGETDIDGQPRVAFGRIDIGADEFQIDRMPGDVDRNGQVDVFDVLLVISAFGLSYGQPGYNLLADLDANGAVDVFDVIDVIINFGAGT